MTDELDPTERRIARRLADFAETPFPASETLDHVIATALQEGRARTSRMRLGALLAAAVVLAIAIGGLAQLGTFSPASTPTPTATPRATAPGFGALHLTADPTGYSNHDPLMLRYVLADGRTLAEFDAVEAETTIDLDRSLPAGAVSVVANDTACVGTITIEAEMEVDAVLRNLDDPCTVSVVATHAIGAIMHPEPRTALGAFVVVDSVLVVRPLDPGNTIGPIHKPADDRAEVLDFDIPPGRYELALEVDGTVLKTLEIDLKRGQEFYYFMRALRPDIPLDCGDVAQSACAAAVAAAYEQPQGSGPALHHVQSVRVRPSRYTGGCQPYDPPVFDVSFAILEDPGTIEITLAARPDGRLDYCTY